MEFIILIVTLFFSLFFSGVFYLHGCKVQSTSLAGKRNTFEIVPWDRKMKHLWLMAESEIDKKRYPVYSIEIQNPEFSVKKKKTCYH